jgi:hypothetical protein
MSLLLRRHKQNKVEKSVPKEPAFSDFPKHTGGGWYELSNGDKVQGKEEAKEAEKEVGD